MDSHRFDALARLTANLVTRRGLVGLALASAVARLAAGETFAKKGNGKKGRKKVTICHLGLTVRVKKKKALVHLRHGDTLGACQPPPLPPVCAAFGQTCAIDNDCCSSRCAEGPAGNICSCLVRGDTCTASANCCSGTCTPGDNECTCHQQGIPCLVSEQCCDGLTCQNVDPDVGSGSCQP